MRLVVENLGGERGGEKVFEKVGFVLESGAALIVTGENGSGKSTLLRILGGLLPIADGAVRLEAAPDYPTLTSASHYLGHENAMKPSLTVTENLRFWQDFTGEPHRTTEEALDLVGLGSVGHLPFGYLSTGQRRRVAIARLMLNRRPVWLLDEPTAGLDKASERQFAAIVEAHLDEGGIVVAATHVPLGLENAEELRMGILPSPSSEGSSGAADRGGGEN